MLEQKETILTGCNAAIKGGFTGVMLMPNTKPCIDNKGIIEFSVTSKLRSKNTEREIWLAFAPIKLNYQNLMIQKATELGITKFIPILTERTIVRKINEKRLNKIIIEASEQSNRLLVPNLENITKLNNFLKLNQNLTV